jgi:hypothetical protein
MLSIAFSLDGSGVVLFDWSVCEIVPTVLSLHAIANKENLLPCKGRSLDDTPAWQTCGTAATAGVSRDGV